MESQKNLETNSVKECIEQATDAPEMPYAFANCSRCGGSHENVMTKPWVGKACSFTTSDTSLVFDCIRYGICPETGAPILISVVALAVH